MLTPISADVKGLIQSKHIPKIIRNLRRDSWSATRSARRSQYSWVIVKLLVKLSGGQRLTSRIQVALIILTATCQWCVL